jgi:hypothetical protein
MDVNTAKEIPKRKSPRGSEGFDPSERNRIAREAAEKQNGRGYVNPRDEDHDEAGSTAPAKSKRTRKARTDSFPLEFRVPAKYEYSVYIAALKAKSKGEFDPGAKRDLKSAFLQACLEAVLEDLLKEFPPA